MNTYTNTIKCSISPNVSQGPATLGCLKSIYLFLNYIYLTYNSFCHPRCTQYKAHSSYHSTLSSFQHICALVTSCSQSGVYFLRLHISWQQGLCHLCDRQQIEQILTIQCQNTLQQSRESIPPICN